MDNTSITLETCSLKWKTGFRKVVSEDGRIQIHIGDMLEGNTYEQEYTFEDLRALFERYARAGERIINGNLKSLETFMDNFGVPIDLNDHNDKSWGYYSSIKEDAIQAYQCLSVWNRDESLKSVIHIYNQHIPKLSVRLMRTDEGYSLMNVLPGLRTGMWLSFIQSALYAPTTTYTRKCLQDDHHRGCGKEFKTLNPSARICGDCKKRINTERQKAKRSRKKYLQEKTMSNTTD